MDTSSAIHTYIILSLGFFVVFAGAIFFLLVRLLSQKFQLNKARAQLQTHSTVLEEKVEARTAELQASTLQLQMSEEKYRCLFESSKEAILVIHGATGEILDFNEEALNLFGCAPEDLKQLSIQELIPAPIFNAGAHNWVETSINRKDGTQRLIDCLTGKITYGDRGCHQVICRDITEKREWDAQVMQTHKLAALGQLAAGVAHEMNNPLGTIYSSAYFLKTDLQQQSPKVQRHFEIIESQIIRCRKIISDLLNFSRAPNLSLDLKQGDIHEILDTCLNLIDKEAQSNGISIKREFQPAPPILLDQERLNQVFFNLTVNALQAMPEGGTLWVRTWIEKQQMQSNGHPDDTWAVICFQDTGVGISPEVMLKMFNPFFTTKKPGQGVGLGLSVSHEIVKQLRGVITAESEPGAGATFYVKLPVR